MLNAGAPVLTMQNILGHKWVDTTLGYARLYDGTLAADYHQAMTVVERQMAIPEDRLAPPPSIGLLLALVDSLRRGTLNETQAETVMQLRAGIMAMAEKEITIEDVKVPTFNDSLERRLRWTSLWNRQSKGSGLTMRLPAGQRELAFGMTKT